MDKLYSIVLKERKGYGDSVLTLSLWARILQLEYAVSTTCSQLRHTRIDDNTSRVSIRISCCCQKRLRGRCLVSFDVVEYCTIQGRRYIYPFLAGKCQLATQASRRTTASRPDQSTRLLSARSRSAALLPVQLDTPLASKGFSSNP